MLNFIFAAFQAFFVVKLVSNLLVSFSCDQGLIATIIVPSLTICASTISSTTTARSGEYLTFLVMIKCVNATAIITTFTSAIIIII